MSKLEANDISVTFGDNKVLENVSFSVERGSFVGLVGANGSGKSSLLRSVLGIIKSPTGNVVIDGQPTSEMTPRQIASKVAYAPQGAEMHWMLPVERLVGIGRTPHLAPWSKPTQADMDVVEHALEVTDMIGLRHRIATTLSGGEKARALLARAIAVGAPYLLADEPVAALDPYHQLQVLDILAEMAQQDHGIVIVLHDLSLAQRYCDRIFLLHDGDVLAKGTPDEVFTDQRLDQAYGVRMARTEHNGTSFLTLIDRSDRTVLPGSS
ncbi:MAG: ABC transporter ATP-binding protein [Alphaproteobacteria bacterium]|nr:ABC transporter ATP-binding protein [Alphaproteobacteria bacterium]MBT4082176.1 ABC transporter ATP-binding protein [Alphaproteobacteria bacterium]MBT4545033.1 ABC transporter ATP-binding protein [Alphaproteobacteria bacterium]MBT7745816.1 ABC transporter ATP-binding protein [Alphaproteobacteria bacterium]